MRLRVLFFGTPAFAVPTLTALAESAHQVIGVVTQPDRPRGRGHRIAAAAVKRVAEASGLPILQPARVKDASFIAGLQQLAPDIAVVAAYGRLLPQALLDVPRLGVLNVHASLLPRWRGAAPIHRAILAGDRTTGVTIMRVVLALDAGPMLDRAITPIEPDETSEALEARLATLGAELLMKTLDRVASGSAIEETAQDDSLATYAARLERTDSPIDWARPAAAIHNQIRGLHPWPLASATLAGRRLLLLRSTVEHDQTGDAAPGTILEASGDALIVSASPGAVRILEIQPEGRRAMSARDFLNGTRVAAGARFT